MSKIIKYKTMKKKFLILTILSIAFCPIFAHADDDWSSFDNVDNAWDGQKTITNKQFEETMDALQAKKKKKEAKAKEKAIKKLKGTSLTPEMDAHKDDILNEDPGEAPEECQVVNIPVDFIIDEKKIERGYYRVIGERKEDGVYLMLYQAHTLKAKIKARETKEDFDESHITFAKIIPYNDQYMKIIFGSVDFNAYAYIPFIEPESLF